MVDTGQIVATMLAWFCLYLASSIVSGNIIVQDDTNCGSLRYPREKSMNNMNEEIVTSHDGQYYLPGKDCVVSILGRHDHQFTVTIEFLQVDQNAVLDPATKEPVKCHDYLKLYDSPRVDNAKLMTAPAGLCGNEGTLPQRRTFTTSCPFLALEFVTDSNVEAYRGFTLKVIQYPWRNPGNINPGAGLVPGGPSWSCYYNEFRPGWDYQSDAIIGGGGGGGGGADLDKEVNGIYCYVCNSCPVDDFRPQDFQGSSYGGCYRCGKQFDITRGEARRKCYSRTDYRVFIESFEDAGLEDGYIGCRDLVNEYNTVIKYCFCDRDHCNSAPVKNVLRPLLVFLVSCTVLTNLF